MLQSLEGEVLALISNAPGKGVALSYLHHLPPTKMGENPTKTWNL
jgi:hypothetical protein